MDEPEKDVNFCYKCGKRVSRQVGKCWYCASPTYRVIRPPRRCPFCESKIGPNAIKCPHCGEFVDGRAPAQHQNVTFVIDKAVISDGRMGLPGAPPGRPYDPSRAFAGPGPAPPALSGPGRGGPNLLPHGGQELLPAPPAPGSPTPYTGGSALAPYGEGGGNPLAPYGGGSGAPLAPYTGDPAAQPLGPYTGAPGGGAMTPYLGPPSAAPITPYVEAAEESKYVVCSNCDAELLRSDNYCFHCGQLQNAAFRQPPRKVETAGSNIWLYFDALVLLGANLALRHVEALAQALDMPQLSRFGGFAYYGSAGAGAMALIVWAFFRRRRFLSQAIAVVYFILALIVMFGL